MASTGDNAPVWFITGCSTGLGRALAQRVLQQGYRAVISARDAKTIEDIVAAHRGTALALALDVTNGDGRGRLSEGVRVERSQ